MSLLDDHDAAVVAAVAAQNVTTDLAAKPAGTGWQGQAGDSDFVAYAIVYPLPGGTRDGSIGDPDRDIILNYQVTCVGDSPEAARSVASDADLGVRTGVTVEGRRVLRVVPVDDGGVQPDDDTQGPRLFYATPRFTVWTSPVSA